MTNSRHNSGMARPDNQNHHQREHDRNEVGERLLAADELGEWMWIGDARDHKNRQ